MTMDAIVERTCAGYRIFAGETLSVDSTRAAASPVRTLPIPRPRHYMIRSTYKSEWDGANCMINVHQVLANNDIPLSKEPGNRAPPTKEVADENCSFCLRSNPLRDIPCNTNAARP